MSASYDQLREMFNHRWLMWFVNTPPVRAAIAGLQAGSTRKRISRKNLGTIPLPVPPIAEQGLIVEQIESQLTRLAAGAGALKRVQANLKRYRAAVLRAACEGRLVPTEAELARREGRSFQPASVLLQRIKAEEATPTAAPHRPTKHRRDAAATEFPDVSPLPRAGPGHHSLNSCPQGASARGPLARSSRSVSTVPTVSRCWASRTSDPSDSRTVARSTYRPRRQGH